MSREKLISPPDRLPLPPPRPSQFSKAISEGWPKPLALARRGGKEGPKWNGISNRNTPELKFAVTHTKQSTAQFLIATFRALAEMPAQDRSALGRSSEAQKLESRLTRFHSTTSKFLIDNFERLIGFASSSHSTLATSLSGAQPRGHCFLIA